MKTVLSFILIVFSLAIFAQVDLNQNLIAYYPFCGSAEDLSNNGNSGVVNGAILTEDRFGKAENAYYFDGIDDYINLGNNDIVNGPFSGLTISAWINLEQGGENQQQIIGKWNNETRDDQYTIINQSNRILFAVGNPNYSSPGFTDDFRLNNDTWYHISVCWDSTGMHRVYINGNLEFETFSDRFDWINPSSDIDLKIGRQINPSYHNRAFKGVIDDVRIYSRVLKQIEIEALYNFGDELFVFKDTTLCPGLTYRLKGKNNLSNSFKVLSTMQEVDSLVMPDTIVYLELSDLQCGGKDTIRLTPELCANCIEFNELNELDICVHDSITEVLQLEDNYYIVNGEIMNCPGERIIYIKNSFCEDWMDSLTLFVRADEDCYNFDIPDSLCQGDNIILDQNANIIVERGPILQDSEGFSQTLLIRDPNCSDIVFTKDVRVLNCTDCKYAIPNIITPNGDGVNDIFRISSNCNFLKFEAQIYDRWGNLIHQSTNPNMIWNGSNRGVGTYVFRIEMILNSAGEQKRIKEHGSITLIK